MNEEIWKSTLDRRYEIVVIRVVAYQGQLTITDAGRKIFSQAVGLMYNAQFGPDIADVAEWKKIAVDFMDNK